MFREDLHAMVRCSVPVLLNFIDMVYHVLNGGALTDRFQDSAIPGIPLVCREAFMEGDIRGETLAQFWQVRATANEALYGAPQSDYFDEVVSQFTTLQSAPSGSEFNLWFGYDVFCQVNMWFVLSLLEARGGKDPVFVVYPTYLSEDNIWQDFGPASVADLRFCFGNRVLFGYEDVVHGKKLWKACQDHDLGRLEQLSVYRSPVFPYLGPVCRAYIDRFPAANETSRPERVVREIMGEGKNALTFSDVFQAFTRREGIYGMGDLQVKALYDKVKQAD